MYIKNNELQHIKGKKIKQKTNMFEVICVSIDSGVVCSINFLFFNLKVNLVYSLKKGGGG